WTQAREVQRGAGTVTMRLTLDRDFLRDLTTFPVHPATMDLATTAGLSLASRESGQIEGLFVPVSYGCIRITGDLPRTVLAHARLNEAGQTSSFDVSIADDRGRELVEVHDFNVRLVDAERLAAPVVD